MYLPPNQINQINTFSSHPQKQIIKMAINFVLFWLKLMSSQISHKYQKARKNINMYTWNNDWKETQISKDCLLP